MKKYIIFAIPALLLGMIVMVYAGFQLLEIRQIYEEGNAAYNELSQMVKKNAPIGFEQLQVQELIYNDGDVLTLPEDETTIHIPDFEIDFEALRQINKDAVAWLYSPGTVIDYPVMRSDDYSYYLNHLPDGAYNDNGSLFIDYNNAPDFCGPLTVIYGHHMKSGSMFGGLKGYKEQGFYDEHPYMYLYTEQANYRIDLMYGVVIAAGKWQIHAFMHSENLESLLEYAKANTTFHSRVEFMDGDRVVALSTCSYEFNDARYVVLGVLRG